jgi:hypothetical protein
VNTNPLEQVIQGGVLTPTIASILSTPHVVTEPTSQWTRELALRVGGKGVFPLKLGTIQANLVGGPYRNKPEGFYGIKMAAEINADCVISIPTEDYSVPATSRLIAGLYCGIAMAQQQVPIWVGCFGGIGRTGLYFAALAKVMARYQKLMKHKVTIDPIRFTREQYLSHAVETKEQIQYIADLNVDAVAEWAAAINGYKPPWWKRFFR